MLALLFAQADQPKVDVEIKQEHADASADVAKAINDFANQMSKDPVVLSSSVLGIILFLVGLICFIMVVVAMFKNDAKGLGIVTILTTIFCGIGPLIAFFFGWLKSGEWKIRFLMTVWT